MFSQSLLTITDDIMFKQNFKYEIQKNQFNQFYYKIYQDKEMVSRSKLYKWEEECGWDACNLCSEYNHLEYTQNEMQSGQ